MPALANFILREEDVVRMVLEFLNNRELNISQLSLERETGVHNGLYSDDLLFLRQLILDGQWEYCLQFIEPLQKIHEFDGTAVQYHIHKHKYLELLCIRSEAGPYQNVEVAVNEVVGCLKELEKCCPTKEDYNEMCLLLTLPSINHHPDFKNWNPSSSRLKCFDKILPFVEKYLPFEKKSEERSREATGDRLLQLIIKGILYESCVNYCEEKATFAIDEDEKMKFGSLLDGGGFRNGDLSLLSWLQSLPSEIFSYPFEQKTLDVDVEQIEKPSLVASWSELIMVTPIKPKKFPHSETPFNRLRASDLMSRSLIPGVVDNFSRSFVEFTVGEVAEMSRSSLAGVGFHLKSSPTPKKVSEQTNVDRLFDGGDVFNSSCIDRLPCSDDNETPANRMLKSPPSSSSTSHHHHHHQKSYPHGKICKSDEPKVGKSGSDHLDSSDLWMKFKQDKKKRHPSDKPNEEKISLDSQDSLTNQHKNEFSYSSMKSAPSSTQKASDIASANEEHLSSTPKSSATRTKIQEAVPPGTSPITSSTITKIKPSESLKERSDQKRHPSHDGKSIECHNDISSTTQKTRAVLNNNFNNEELIASKQARFIPVTKLEDAQAIRAVEFHPHGRLYAIGSNSKTLRICEYPKNHELRSLKSDHEAYQPNVLLKKLKHHKGSIYCLGWSGGGDVLATGSNDKTIKMMRFDEDTCDFIGTDTELTMHDGTIRDLCFMEDSNNGSTTLVSGGAGDCKIYITDCETFTPYQALSGHSGPIHSLYSWGSNTFVSGSLDRTIRFWDLRTRGCVNLITAPPAPGLVHGSSVNAVCVESSGCLLVSGHEDGNCMLYDIRGGRIVQIIRPHTSEIRTIRFSPKSFYLLTGGYDDKIILTDLQGDLTKPTPSLVVAEQKDKVIQGRWHPNDFTFLTTSADKTAILWSLPN
ncbi:WD repeat-containing protein 47-like isoform X2 [Brevipalpus obovatus]|uniref:WD repeat-containing protein 47-like isoform X2 n=1 Tax=Brevipalpus obovatus TaxID=246614 RepID=UPI003D9EDBF0